MSQHLHTPVLVLFQAFLDRRQKPICLLHNVCSRLGNVPDEPFKHEGMSDLPEHIRKNFRWLLTRRAYCWKDACSLMLLRALRSVFCCQQSSAAVEDCRRHCRSTLKSIQPCRALKSTCGYMRQTIKMQCCWKPCGAHSTLAQQRCYQRLPHALPYNSELYQAVQRSQHHLYWQVHADLWHEAPQ